MERKSVKIEPSSCNRELVPAAPLDASPLLTRAHSPAAELYTFILCALKKERDDRALPVFYARTAGMTARS